jgi:hypothetical protein
MLSDVLKQIGYSHWYPVTKEWLYRAELHAQNKNKIGVRAPCRQIYGIKCGDPESDCGAEPIMKIVTATTA